MDPNNPAVAADKYFSDDYEFTRSDLPIFRSTQWICSSKYLFFMQIFAGWEMWRNNSPWKESVAGKKIIQGVREDLKSRIAATGYLYGLLTTQDLHCAL